MREQKGYVFHKGKSWFVRYCDTRRQPDGTTKRKLCCEKLKVAYGGEYRTEKSVRPFVQDLLRPVNSGSLIPMSTMPLVEFIERVYIPEHVEKLRPASVKQYRDIWYSHVKAHVSGFTLRGFRTCDGQQVMNKIAAPGCLGRSVLRHAKSFLSGAFRQALQKGYLEGYIADKNGHEPANPMQNVSVPSTSEVEDTYAYSLSEIKSMLAAIKEPARTVVLTAAFTGLRKSELRGLAWGDFDGHELAIRRSVWGTKKLAKKLDASSVWGGVANPPKTKSSRASIPVIRQLADALEAHRQRAGILAQPDLPIFQTGNGQPLSLDNLARRVIAPVSKWHGWHAFRRGLATNLHAIGIDDKTIQTILRHSNINLTMNIYVKTVSESQVNAMDALSQKFETYNELATNQSQVIN